MDVRFKKKKYSKTVLSLVVFLLAISVLSFKFENTLSTDRIKSNRIISFPINTPVLQDNALIFFGFVGCVEICTTRMREISEIYTELAKSSGSEGISVLFVNLDAMHSSDIANSYAQSYNSHFKGVTFDQNDLTEILRLFQASYSLGLLSNREINHSQFLYFVQRDSKQHYFLKNIFTHVPLDKDRIVTDLVGIII